MLIKSARKANMGRTTVNVSDDVLKKLLRVKKSRPQDASRNETMNFVLDFYLERQINPFQDGQKPAISGKIPSPIIDAEKSQKETNLSFKTASQLLEQNKFMQVKK